MKKNDNNELLIKKILENSKILIKKFVKSRPTLEDIFVYKVEKANKE